jgi:hypothetical protein
MHYSKTVEDDLRESTKLVQSFQCHGHELEVHYSKTMNGCLKSLMVQLLIRVAIRLCQRANVG